MRRPGTDLRRHALRTAAVSTALVAAALAAVLAATDLIVEHSLTAAVDQRLADWMGEVAGAGGNAAVADSDFDAPILSWIALPGGRCTPVGNAPALPSGLCSAGGPASAAVNGIPFRVEGRRLASGALTVAGESLAPASRQLSDVVLAELVVGPLLLVVVFAGSLAIGSRVGGSVERMRQRQLAFTADASHELRTPLSVIKAETDVALAGGDRSLRPALTRVSGEIGRMRRIVEDLLWLARFDSEPEPPEPADIDLVTAAAVAVERFAALAQARSLSLEVESPELTLPISIPPDWLERLIGVLLDNACRHARSRVVVGVRALPGRRVEMSVSDDGEGISESELPRIFDRFHRATAGGEGAGLGLAIADAVVRSSGGRWDVSPAQGGGARFAVAWPLGRAAQPISRTTLPTAPSRTAS